MLFDFHFSPVLLHINFTLLFHMMFIMKDLMKKHKQIKNMKKSLINKISFFVYFFSWIVFSISSETVFSDISFVTFGKNYWVKKIVKIYWLYMVFYSIFYIKRKYRLNFYLFFSTDELFRNKLTEDMIKDIIIYGKNLEY